MPIIKTNIGVKMVVNHLLELVSKYSRSFLQKRNKKLKLTIDNSLKHDIVGFYCLQPMQQKRRFCDQIRLKNLITLHLQHYYKMKSSFTLSKISALLVDANMTTLSLLAIPSISTSN